jgi:hypothetical protein
MLRAQMGITKQITLPAFWRLLYSDGVNRAEPTRGQAAFRYRDGVALDIIRVTKLARNDCFESDHEICSSGWFLCKRHFQTTNLGLL